MDNWKDPRKNPRKWFKIQHRRVTTDTLLTILIVVMWIIAMWAMANLGIQVAQALHSFTL